MRILITSNKHSHYNKTGIIIKDDRDKGVQVRIDRTEEVVHVPNGQFKVTTLQP